MPTMKETKFTATITWLGVVPKLAKGRRAEPVDAAFASYAGFEDDVHAGLTRASCVRVTNLYPKGTDIRNVRQLSILSDEEMSLIAADMGLDTLDPMHLGTSMVIKGIPDFTHVPPNARLQATSGATITIDMENRPCVLPGREIEKDSPGHGPKFKSAAAHRRGVTAWIEREGLLRVGDTLRLFIPDQPAWQHG
ncbi:MOSC domain-containing protein [Sulfitobacter sp. BSw21498]|uniref:MOSC domain-containing protein n=1 Tax=Sulfitobacter sp. BSw21498 TaxID=664426 RepID=UPI0011100B11|nr:sulfurase [Sulfitobacter sp. BSw21498]